MIGHLKGSLPMLEVAITAAAAVAVIIAGTVIVLGLVTLILVRDV